MALQTPAEPLSNITKNNTSLITSPPYHMNMAQHYTRKKTQPIIGGREDMQTAKGSMIVDLGWMEKDEERKW